MRPSRWRFLICHASSSSRWVQVANSLKYYSTAKNKYPKTTYNSSYQYGAPHPESNIPNIKFSGRNIETKKGKLFRECKQDLMAWHHIFWLQHNHQFKKEKKQYVQRRECKNIPMNGKERADELSLFYKNFLDKNFQVHFKYQREWYKRNFMVLWYGLQVDLERFVKWLTAKTTWSS